MTGHGTTIAIPIGSAAPAVQVLFDPEGDPPGQTWFTIVFSDAPPPDELDDEQLGPVCAHCLIEEYGQDLGRGLDAAMRCRGSVERDQATGEWRIATDPRFLPYDEEDA